jgi:hypothetical protein
LSLLRLRADLRVIRFLIVVAALVVCAARCARAQETVFDVPSADVLDAGKVYGELDGTVRPVNPAATFTPRVVVGIGHDIEVGLNFNGLAAPTTGQLDLSPTIKWKPWHTDSGWSFYVGDDLFFPVRDRGYDAGNYVYASFSKEWASTGTRVGFGAYDFTRDVVATGNRAGGQFTIEQSVTKRVTLAAEWYTGDNAVGYVNPGAVWKLTKKLTLYTAYQIGNSGVTHGNHNFLWEFGYNFN